MDASVPRLGSLERALANGRALLERDPVAAADQAREILRISPAQVDAFNLLGKALRKLGRIEEAQQIELEAVRASSLNPAIAKAAIALREQQFNEAERLLRPHLRAHPEDAAALRMLAEIAVHVGAFDDAEQLLLASLSVAPKYDSARARLAKLYEQGGRWRDALLVLEQILQDDPDNSRARAAQAAVLLKIGEYDAALEIYDELIRRQPGSAALCMSKGHVLKTIGRTADCVVAYRRALELDPALGEVWWSMANLKSMRFSKMDVLAMRSALNEQSLDETHRMHLNFALGKALEDSKEFEESFHFYVKGNRIRRAMLDYEADRISAEVDQAQALFTPDFFRARADWGALSPDPIFILGMPRAGSTLIEQILSGHSKIEGTSELPHIPLLVQRLIADRMQSGPASYPNLIDQLERDTFPSIGEAYLAAAKAHRKTDKPFFIDKLPNNWLHIGLIHLILPNARIIDVRRHPLGCCFSNFKQHFAHGQGFSYSLEEMGIYYRDYVRMLRHYDEAIPGVVHRIFYEDLIEKPAQEIEKLLTYLGFEFEEACLNFHQNQRAVRTASAEQVRRPLNKDGVDHWRNFEKWLGPLTRTLGSILTEYPKIPAELR